MKSILRNRSLLILGAADVINSLGSWITSMALYAVLIFQSNGSMALSSGIFLASLGPALLLSPFAGWLCDRYDRRMLMVISRLLQGAVTAGLVFTDNLALIYTLLVIGSICGLVMGPARTTAMPDIVPPEELTQANAFMQQVTGLIKILSPALAGGLLTVMDPHTAIWLDVVSFAVSAAILLLLPPLPARKAEAATAETGAGGSMIRESLAVLYRNAPGLLLLLPLNVLVSLVLVAFDVGLAVYVRDVLQATIAYKGIIGLTVGIGTIAGSSVFLVLKGHRNLWRDVIAGFILLIALPAGIALGEVSGPPAGRVILAAACMVGGLGLGVINVQAGVLFLRICPPGWLGRVTGVFDSITVTGRLAGLLATPLLVPAVVSFGGYFGIAAVLMLLATALTAFALGRLSPSPAPALSTNEVAANDA
jgi:MFS family permease